MNVQQKKLTLSALDKLRHAIGFHQADAQGRTHRRFTAMRAHYDSTVPDADLEQARECGLVHRGTAVGKCPGEYAVRSTPAESGRWRYVLTDAGIALLCEMLECDITCELTYEKEAKRHESQA